MMLRLAWLCFSLFLAACQATDGVLPTATTLRVVPATVVMTLVPTAVRPLHTVAAQTSVLPTPDAAQDACQATAGLPTTQHTVTAAINYDQHSVVVQQHVHTINRGSESLDQVVFDVEPNRYAGVFMLDGVTADRPLLSYELTGRRLTLDLSEPFLPGCSFDVDLAFTVKVEPIGRGVGGFGGYLGYSNRQLNLGQWLAALAERRDGQWITHDVIAIGEQTVVDVADWDMTLIVADTPDSMRVAAPGMLVDQSGDHWHYTLANARDFTISLSPYYNVLKQTTTGGVSVELYNFGDRTVETPDGTVNSAEQALTAAAQSLSMYSDLFGSYPYPRFVIIQGDFPDGMEFSGIVFVSDDWFRTNTGTPQSYLTIITVHETSHQWWYARVGSDQALTPWLDEALATYSEYVFYEEFYPDLKDWWWNFRVDSFVPSDYRGKPVNSTVYEFANVRDYINAVYLEGVHMFDEMREMLGTDVFFDWLRRYAQAGDNRIVTPDVFWSLLTPEQLQQIAPIRAHYLRADPPSP